MKTSTQKFFPDCNQLKDKIDFVDVNGNPNPRGKRCRVCFEDRRQKERDAFFNIGVEYEKSIMRKLEIVYGEYWYSYTDSHIFRLTLCLKWIF